MADVLTAIDGGIGRITLTRPRSLNALTLGMVETIRAALDAWETNPTVRFVLIEGAGGHSWSDAGRPNPIATMSEAIAISVERSESR